MLFLRHLGIFIWMLLEPVVIVVTVPIWVPVYLVTASWSFLAEVWECARPAAPSYPDCGACPGDGTICPRTCRLAEESPPVPRGVPPSEKVQLPDKARPGIEVLHRVVESLLTTCHYTDEEGDETLKLADLAACIADPPFRLKDGCGVPGTCDPESKGGA